MGLELYLQAIFFPVGKQESLSPFLFIVVMDAFRELLIVANLIGGFEVVRGGRGRGYISHLLYADYAFDFCDPSREQLCDLSGEARISKEF